MFLACGVDLYTDPIHVVVLDKKGALLKSSLVKRSPSSVVLFLEGLPFYIGKTIFIFCAITSDNVQHLPEFVEGIREANCIIKAYDFDDVLRMENMLKDLQKGTHLFAYCLAKLVQSESLDLMSFQEEIQQLYEMRNKLDRMIRSLSTVRAFPDDHHILHKK